MNLSFLSRAQAKALVWTEREYTSLARSGKVGAGAAAVVGVGAAAVPATASAQSCNSGGADGGRLQGIIDGAAGFLIILGGSLSILMFAIGGFMILGSGLKREWVGKGMSVVKYALVGLVILVIGGFVKTVVLSIIGAAGSSTGGTDAKANADCANKGLK